MKRRNYINGIWVSNNFLARNVLKFSKRGDLVVMIDMPEDIKKNNSGETFKVVSSIYRASAKHVQDIKNLIRHLKNSLGIKEVYLIGVSRGTISVANLTDRVPLVKGAVLLAAVVSDPFMEKYCKSHGGDFLECTGFTKTSKRLLFIHHRRDGCVSSMYESAVTAFKMVKAPAKKFITVEGGAEVADEPCWGLTHHGFFGKDEEVVNLILDWM